jgi:hypothetical protein
MGLSGLLTASMVRINKTCCSRSFLGVWVHGAVQTRVHPGNTQSNHYPRVTNYST